MAGRVGGYTAAQVEEVRMVMRMLPVFFTTILFWTIYCQASCVKNLAVPAILVAIMCMDCCKAHLYLHLLAKHTFGATRKPILGASEPLPCCTLPLNSFSISAGFPVSWSTAADKSALCPLHALLVPTSTDSQYSTQRT